MPVQKKGKRIIKFHTHTKKNSFILKTALHEERMHFFVHSDDTVRGKSEHFTNVTRMLNGCYATVTMGLRSCRGIMFLITCPFHFKRQPRHVI